MEETISKITKRISDLREGLVRLQNTANAHIGAIQELERLKSELEETTKAEITT